MRPVSVIRLSFAGLMLWIFIGIHLTEAIVVDARNVYLAADLARLSMVIIRFPPYLLLYTK